MRLGWGKCSGCEDRDHLLTTYERMVSSLRSEIQDLRDSMAKAEERWATERAGMLDKITALASPMAAAALGYRRPERAPQDPAARPRIHFPGYEPNLRPEPDRSVPRRQTDGDPKVE